MNTETKLLNRINGYARLVELIDQLGDAEYRLGSLERSLLFSGDIENNAERELVVLELQIIRAKIAKIFIK